MKEEEIRPKAIFDEYLQLCEEDTRKYFDAVECTDVHCPACGQSGEFSFNKNSFDYAECPNCKTLFVSPRPAPLAFAK